MIRIDGVAVRDYAKNYKHQTMYKTVQKEADEAYKYEAAVLERLEYLRYKKNPTHDERVEYEALKRIKEEVQG